MSIADTLLIGKGRHIIELQYPCGEKISVVGDHGQAPTLQRLAETAREHRDSCPTCV